MLRIKLGRLILGVAGCCFIASCASVHKQEAVPESFFKDVEGHYKIAYVLPKDACWPPSKRSDIVVSNFDGTDKKNITEWLYPGERTISLYPAWSPDGQWLLFQVIRNLEKAKDLGDEIIVELYIADAASLSYRKLYSYQEQGFQGQPYNSALFKGAWWSKDSKNILLFQMDQFHHQALDSQDDHKKPILISIDSLIPPQDFAENHYDDFVQRSLFPSFRNGAKYFSPDGEYEVSLVRNQDVSLGPKGAFMPSIGDILNVHLRDGGLFLSKKNSLSKRRISDGIGMFSWTQDSKYIILDLGSAGGIHIVDLKGQSRAVEGMHPDVQYGISYTKSSLSKLRY